MRRAGHDLKNNCAAVIAHCELALMEIDRGDMSALARRLNTIKEIELFSCDIINKELFDSTIAPGIFDFNAIIRTTVSHLSCSLNGIEPFVHLHDEELPVRGDSAAAIRMLQNILMNARNAIAKAKRTSNGHIAITSHRLTPDFARVEIGDNGCGMLQEEASKYWSESRTERNNGEHGFGLACVREALEGLRGSLQITTSLGRGTVVTLLLPLWNVAPIAAVIST